MEIQVKILKVLEPQTFTSSRTNETYTKNVFIGTTQGQYPKNIAFSVMGQDKFTQMGIVVGGVYVVSFDVESREWRERWFTECSAWKCVRVDVQQSSTNEKAQERPQEPAPSTAATPPTNDLPF